MAGTGSAEGNLTVRFQFRLDLRDPQQNELARELQELPGGQRNRFIVERLTELNAPAVMDTAAIKAAMREVLLEFSASIPQHEEGSMPGAPAVPDDVYDVAGLL